MKPAIAAILGMCVTSFAFAGPVKPASAQAKGINESVTIEKLQSGNWGNTFEMRGFTIGTGVITLVPVTREAAAVLQALDSSTKYSCIIQNSTYVPKLSGGNETVGATYYVLDINCN